LFGNQQRIAMPIYCLPYPGPSRKEL